MINNNEITKWNYPTTIYHGIDSVNIINNLLAENNYHNPLLVTDSFLVKSDLINKITSNLCKNSKHSKFTIFSDLNSDPDRDIVYQALDILKTNNNDCIIIIGGGSSLDLGKTLALMAKHDHDLWHFVDGAEDYINLDSSEILPTIAIPTTAGTGSEVGRVAVIIDNNTKRKKFIFHPNLVPNWVLLDPKITTSMPANLTAATGMDALTHAIEAYCVNSYHPAADGIAIESIRLIKNNLLSAYNNPNDLSARGNMLAAATMAATAFQKGLGAVHSLSHPIGAIYKVHHGLLNAVFLPYVLKLNQKAIEHKMQYLSQVLELDFISTIEQTTGTDSVINWLLDLREKLSIPHTINKLSAEFTQELNSANKRQCLDKIIQEALLDPSTPTNPVELTYDNLNSVLLKAIDGEI